MSEPEPAPETRYVPSYPTIRKIDAIWCQVERYAVAGMFLFMAGIVVLSLIGTSFGVRGQWLILLGLIRVPYDLVVVLSLCGVVLFGIRTRTVKDGERPLSWGLSIGLSLAITLVVALAVWLYTRRYPTGIIWGQKVSMVFLIWVSMLGSSIATQDRSHLALEMGEKLWPLGIRHLVKAFAHVVSTLFCVGFFLVAVEMILTMRKEGAAISPLADWFPLWVAYLAVPYCFLAMSVRFLAQAVTTATGTAAPMEERLPT